MKKFVIFEDAWEWKYDNGESMETGVFVIDNVQFPLGEVAWVVIANGYQLDDYEEHVTQYGVTSEGEWAAVSGGHCSCYGWEEMEDSDITYYPSLEVLVKADPGAEVIIQHRDVLNDIYHFLDI